MAVTPANEGEVGDQSMQSHLVSLSIVVSLLGSAPPVVADGLRLEEVTSLLQSRRETVRIVCLGDSVTGVYYHTGGRRAWPDMLGIALKRAYPDAKLEIYNAGISGNRSAAGLVRLDRDVLAHRPHLVVVMFGLNDIRQGNRQAYRDNLKTIVDRCRKAGAAVVLCTLNSVYPNEVRPMPAVTEYSQMVRDVAEAASVPVADCFKRYEEIRAQNPTEWMLLMSETIHPCMEGHKLFAETVAETIAGTRVSLADVPPPADALRFTLARLKAGQPVHVIAMKPYDTIIRDVLLQQFPGAEVQVTPWPVEGQSLAAIVEWAKSIRQRKPNLVVAAVPADAAASDEESFIRDYQWVVSWSLPFDRAKWDFVPILPTATGPVSEDDLPRVELARRMIVGRDFEYVDRKKGDTRPAREILLEWMREHAAEP
jgi:acyl-CoA thioesterase-1